MANYTLICTNWMGCAAPIFENVQNVHNVLYNFNKTFLWNRKQRLTYDLFWNQNKSQWNLLSMRKSLVQNKVWNLLTRYWVKLTNRLFLILLVWYEVETFNSAFPGLVLPWKMYRENLLRSTWVDSIL